MGEAQRKLIPPKTSAASWVAICGEPHFLNPLLRKVPLNVRQRHRAYPGAGGGAAGAGVRPCACAPHQRLPHGHLARSPLAPQPHGLGQDKWTQAAEPQMLFSVTGTPAPTPTLPMAVSPSQSTTASGAGSCCPRPARLKGIQGSPKSHLLVKEGPFHSPHSPPDTLS